MDIRLARTILRNISTQGNRVPNLIDSAKQINWSGARMQRNAPKFSDLIRAQRGGRACFRRLRGNLRAPPRGTY